MPRIRSQQMTSNHRITGDWCPGCGLFAYVNKGEHRSDCTKGRKYRAGDGPAQSTTAIHSGDNPLHDGPDTRASPNP